VIGWVGVTAAGKLAPPDSSFTHKLLEIVNSPLASTAPESYRPPTSSAHQDLLHAEAGNSSRTIPFTSFESSPSRVDSSVAGSGSVGGPLDQAEAISQLMAQRSAMGDDSAKWFTALFSALQVLAHPGFTLQ
jgi:hypothetical protein